MEQIPRSPILSEETPAKVQQPHGSRPHLLKVAATSRPASVAGAIAGSIRDHGCCEVQAIGAGAINQAIKALAIARRFLIPEGSDLTMVPAFKDLELNGEERTAIRLIIGGRRVT